MQEKPAPLDESETKVRWGSKAALWGCCCYVPSSAFIDTAPQLIDQVFDFAFSDVEVAE